MTTERSLRWATNFFIWSAVVALVLEAFPISDRWSRSVARHRAGRARSAQSRLDAVLVERRRKVINVLTCWNTVRQS
jgi:hypothetical protein